MQVNRFLKQQSGAGFVACPICNKQGLQENVVFLGCPGAPAVPASVIDIHLDTVCLLADNKPGKARSKAARGKDEPSAHAAHTPAAHPIQEEPSTAAHTASPPSILNNQPANAAPAGSVGRKRLLACLQDPLPTPAQDGVPAKSDSSAPTTQLQPAKRLAQSALPCPEPTASQHFSIDHSTPVPAKSLVPGVWVNPAMQVVPHRELPGLVLLLNFITPDEETQLLHLADTLAPAWAEKTYPGRYKGKAWGAVHSLIHKTVTPAVHPLPDLVLVIMARMRAAHRLLINFRPNHCNLNNYTQGHSWLKAHCDDRMLSRDLVCNLSLAGQAFVTFEREKGAKHKVKVLLPRCSLQIMSGVSRYQYTHAIAAEDILDPRRVSINFRYSPLTGG